MWLLGVVWFISVMILSIFLPTFAPGVILCANLIIDGKIMNENLNNVRKDENWLKKELKVKGYKELDNILLATLDVNEKLVIYEKNPGLEPFDVLE